MGTTASPLYEFEDVVVEIAGERVLGPLTTSLPDGGVTVVLGPSGSGKTTLLRMCNRLEVPTRGRVRFRGDDVAELDPLWLRRNVGMVFQRPALFAGTVGDNLRAARPEADDDELRRALDEVGLTAGFVDRRHEDLSGGEAQRVCTARTLLAGPEVVLMDEPTSSLDPDKRLDMEKLAVELARAGRPVVWVTHDLRQAERLADARIVLIDGRRAEPEEERAFLRRRPGEAEEGRDDDD